MYWHSNLNIASKAPFLITFLHLSITQLIHIFYPPLHSLSILTLLYWTLLAIVLFSYYLVAYRNPGFIEQALDQIISRENNVEVTTTKKPGQHQKYLSTENGDHEHGNENPEEIIEEKTKTNMKGPLIDQNIQTPPIKAIKEEVKEEIVMIETRFCTVCCLEQPLRAKHCRECGKCVAVHDHHCPWIGLCIGEKNRFYFWWYLVFETFLLWISAVLVVMSIRNVSGWDWFKENWAKILIILVISFFVLMVTCLLGYHSYLSLTNQTTWENISWEKISYMKQFKRKDGSPFSRGVLANLYYYCCKKYPQAYTIWHITKKTKVSS